MSTKFTHIDEQGAAHMVNVGGKDITRRIAIAESLVYMQVQTLDMIVSGEHKKGDVLATARIAGIMAAKKCHELIPLCHALSLSAVAITLEPFHHKGTPGKDGQGIRIEARCELDAKTGVEMEALTAASVAALTLYDMCKAVDKAMVISGTRVLEKQGGRSGTYLAES